MRLIDADALMGVDIKIGHIGEKTVRAIQWAAVDAFYRNIDEAPTIDAVPVVRGEWVSKGGCRCDCSVCGGTVLGRTDRTGWADSAFCGYCGAKMEGEKK